MTDQELKEEQADNEATAFIFGAWVGFFICGLFLAFIQILIELLK